jgi:Flp pilus assembly protein TadB
MSKYKDMKDNVNKKLSVLNDRKEEMSDKELIKLKRQYEKEILRTIRMSILNLGIVYGIAGLSFWYLSKITFFMIAYIYSVAFLFAYVFYQYRCMVKERKQSYQDLLDMCEIPKGRHDSR